MACYLSASHLFKNQTVHLYTLGTYIHLVDVIQCIYLSGVFLNDVNKRRRLRDLAATYQYFGLSSARA
jgi:hypothetical protein